MSEKKSHARTGQVAVLVGLILLAVAAAIFWNWDLIQSGMQSVDWNPSSLLENTTLQFMLIIAAMIVMLFAYLMYNAKRPKAFREV